MSLDIHPAMETVVAELVSSSIVIAAGIYFDYKRLKRISIAFTVVGFIIMAITTQIDVLVMPLLGFYLAIGVLVAVFKAELLYGLFGAKTYGALLLAIAVIHTRIGQPLLNAIPSASTVEKGWAALTQFYQWLLATWIITAICVWIIARIAKSKSTVQLRDEN